MGHPLGGSSQHHADEVISGFQAVFQTIPATKPHLPLALQIPSHARGQAKEGGELWAQGVQVQTGGGIQHVCEEPVCSLTSPWLGKSTRVIVMNWNSILLWFPKVIPSPYIRWRMLMISQGRLVPVPKPLFQGRTCSWLGREAIFWWLGGGKCGCVGSGCLGQTPARVRTLRECWIWSCP